jgi:hypothetical protein
MTSGQVSTKGSSSEAMRLKTEQMLYVGSGEKYMNEVTKVN